LDEIRDQTLKLSFNYQKPDDLARQSDSMSSSHQDPEEDLNDSYNDEIN
jgi:hypothetical protein